MTRRATDVPAIDVSGAYTLEQARAVLADFFRYTEYGPSNYWVGHCVICEEVDGDPIPMNLMVVCRVVEDFLTWMGKKERP